MKILTVLGTRPEIIRLSRVIAALDDLCDHKVVFTGQNFSPELSTVFFNELNVRQPDYQLDTKAEGTWRHIGNILAQVEDVLRQERPDRFLVLGDTNSALTAMIAKRMGIPVYHMEAGNRCFDDRVPEEVNRRAIDHSSDVLLPYTNRSRDHLLREGFHPNRVYVTGNPILEVLRHYEPQIDASDVVSRLRLEPGRYALVTLHRAENVDRQERLASFFEGFKVIHQKCGVPVVLSMHPHTRARLAAAGLDTAPEGLVHLTPLGFFDFVKLEKQALIILSDSGTVQEEGCILGAPSVTLRDATERPETLECGSNILSGCDPDDLLRCVSTVLGRKGAWNVPVEYLEPSVSNIVANLLTGFRR